MSIYSDVVNFITRPLTIDITSEYNVIHETNVMLAEAAILKRIFNIELILDDTEHDIIGPQEVDIEYEKLLGPSKMVKACVFSSF